MIARIRCFVAMKCQLKQARVDEYASARPGQGGFVSLSRREVSHSRGVIFVLALALSGCGLDREEPSIALPQLPKQFAAQKAAAARPVRDWARQFGSTELTRLAETAETQNFDIAAAFARITQAEAQARIAGSALYPQSSASESASRSLSSGAARSKEPPFRGSIGNRFSLGLTASYTIDLFGRNKALTESSEANATAAVFDRDVITITTIASLANLYFQLVADQDHIRLAQDNIKTAERVLEAIRARLSVGTATALDTAQQESVVANQRASVPALQQNLEQNRNLLGVLVGRAPEVDRIKGGSLRGMKLPSVRPGLPSQLLLRRPDIAAAEARLGAQNANVFAARAAFFPTITLTGNLGFESITLANLLRPEAIAASLAQGLTQPIFNGYNLEGQLQLAKGREIELVEAYRKAIVTALSDVENALIAVRQTANHERLQQVAVKAALKAYQITQERLREGTIDVVTLLNTQLTLFQAQDQLIQTRLQRLQAIVSLYQALGGGWSREGLVIVPDPAVAAAQVAEPAQ